MKCLLLSLIVLLSLFSVLQADELLGPDRNVIREGRVIEVTNTHIKIEVIHGTSRIIMTFPRSEVTEIVYKPLDIDLIKRKGYNHLAKENYREAVATFRMITEMVPDFAEAHADHAFALQLSGDYKPAIKAFRKAAKLEPAEGLHRASLGLLFQELGDEPEAVKEFLEYEKVTGKTLRSQKLLGSAFFRVGKFRKAQGRLVKAFELAPRNADVTLALGVLHERMGYFKEAAQAYERLTLILPGRSDGWRLLGELYAKASYFADAAKFFERAVKWSTSVDRARLEMRLKMVSYSARTAENPFLVGRENFLGVKVDGGIDLEKLKSSIAEALAIDTDFAHAHFLTGQARMVRGLFLEAEKSFLRAANLAIGREALVAEIHAKACLFRYRISQDAGIEGRENFLGVSFFADADWKDVLKKARVAHGLLGGIVDALYVEAVALAHLDKFDDALQVLDEYAAEKPALTDKVKKARAGIENLRKEWQRKKGF